MKVATPRTATTPSAASRGMPSPAPSKSVRSPVAAEADGHINVKGARQLQHLSMWARQLYVLLHSGTPLVQSLAAIEKQVAAGPWRTVLEEVRARLDGGVSFADAIAQHPKFFGPVARSLVAAGESSGQLDTMLDRLARLTRQQLRIRRSLTGAMIYPAMLVVVSIVVVVAMVGFVLPRFAELFDTMDAPLPPTTQLLMTIGEQGREHWWLVLGAIGGTMVLGAMLHGSASGKVVVDGWMVRLPCIGRIVRSFEMAKITRILGVLLESRVPLLDALSLTRHSSSNMLYRMLITDAEEAVVKGDTVSGILAKSRLVTPSLAEAVRHGEESGQIGPIMVEMADFMDEENEIFVRTLTSIIEPVILVGMGAVVAFIAMSMFLPLFDLTAMTHGG